MGIGRTYLVAELSHNFVQSVGLLGKVLGLREEVLGGLEGALAPRELVHGEGHRRHVLRSLHDVVVLLEGRPVLLPFFRLRFHFRGYALHLEAGFRDFRLLLAVQSHRFQGFTGCPVFLIGKERRS